MPGVGVGVGGSQHLAVRTRPGPLQKYSVPGPSPPGRGGYLFAQVLADDLADLLHAALRGVAVQHLQRAGVLLGQQVVQGPQVLAHLDERAPVGTAELTETPGRTEVYLQGDEPRPERSEPHMVHRILFPFPAPCLKT